MTLKPSFSRACTRIGPPAGEAHGLREGRPVRRGDDDLVAAVEQGLAGEVEGLLAAHGDRDLLGREGDLEVLAVARGHGGPQLGEPRRRRVPRAAGLEGAAVAAATTCAGVGWSGSPTLKSRTRRPAALSAAARWAIATVGETSSAERGARGRRPTPRSCGLHPPGLRGRPWRGRRAPARRTSRAGGAPPPAAPGRVTPPAELEDLLHEPRREVRVALGRHHEDGLDARVQAPVHERHLELVLEVGDRAEAAHDDRRAPTLLRVVDEQAGEGVDAAPAVPPVGLADDLHPLLDREERAASRGSPGWRRRTSSKTDRPRAMMSRWPFVMGSKEPGKTASDTRRSLRPHAGPSCSASEP